MARTKPASKTLEKMRLNPKGDWQISDIVKVCRDLGMHCQPPTGGGSHYKVSSHEPVIKEILTIPNRKPIKPPYIRDFVKLADKHMQAAKDHPGT